jgi:hypothetical protein
MHVCIIITLRMSPKGAFVIHPQSSSHCQLFQTRKQVITHALVPLPPHCVEPRVRKQRPKPYPLIQQTCTILKAKLAA